MTTDEEPAPSPLPRARLVTPRGRGAVATIEVHGSATDFERLDDLFAAASGKKLAEQPLGRIAFGVWGAAEPQEELVIVRAAATLLEVHCHGGDACVNRILDDLSRVGFRSEPGILHSPKDRLEAAMDEAITRVVTLKTASLLLKQQRLWRELLDRDEGPTESERAAISHWTSFGLHLTEPWQVVIVGEPNVGKSTLLNALLGFERSIVFDQPGTTRDVVSAQTVFDGWPVVLSDTAGLRESRDAIETSGIQFARSRGAEADLCLVLSDLTGQNSTPIGLADGPSIRVGNKVDRISGGKIPAGIEIAVSAQTGENVEALIDLIVRALVPALPAPNQCVPVSREHVAWLDHSSKPG